MTMPTDPPAFFPYLLGTRHGREVKVSAAFAACFHHSQLFRERVTALLSNVCSVRRLGGGQWSCQTEVHQPRVGRIDVQLTAVPSNGRVPVGFWLESKVEAPLTQEQLRRYRRVAEGRFLIALTKHPPDTGSRWLQEEGIFSLRWQDIHRALKGSRARGADRFIIDSFTDYLEALDMAHREDITLEDLRKLARLLAQIDSPKSSEMRVGNAFDIGTACLGLTDDVLQIVLDVHGRRLRRWKRWGPSYFKWFEDGTATGHYIGFRFHDGGWKNWFAAMFHFPGGPDREPTWHVSGKLLRGKPFDKPHRLGSLTGRGGAIDPQKLASRFISDAKKFGVL